MIAYEARMEETAHGYVVEFPALNYGFLHTADDGGRATLEASIRSVIEEIEGAKDFVVVLNFVDIGGGHATIG